MRPEMNVKGVILSLILREAPHPLFVLSLTDNESTCAVKWRSRSRRERIKSIKNQFDYDFCIPLFNNELHNSFELSFHRFLPASSEFTLVFFGSVKYCRNTMRVFPIVSKFVEEVNNEIRSDSNRDCCAIQVIFISRDEISEVTSGSASIKPWWYVIDLKHRNFNTLHRILTVNATPCLFVLDNKTGRVVSNYGLQTIEYYAYEPMIAIQAWRQGDHGLPVFQQALQSCSVS